MKALAKHLVSGAKKFDFNGYVLEIWPQIPDQMPYEPLIDLIKTIGNYFLNLKLRFL